MRSKTDKKLKTLKEYCSYCGNEVYIQNGKWVYAYPSDVYQSPVHKECLEIRDI